MGPAKTTLIKMLCGLYAPTQGTITVDKHRIPEYCIDEYYSMFSVVFQDILFMPVSIAKNIALTEEKNIDHEKLERVLRLSGLYDKVQGLPEKENTLLLKSCFGGCRRPIRRGKAEACLGQSFVSRWKNHGS